MTTIVRHILFTYKRIRNAIDYMFVRDLPTSNRDSLTDRLDCSARQSERGVPAQGLRFLSLARIIIVIAAGEGGDGASS